MLPLYLSEIKKTKSLSLSEEKELSRRIRQNDRKALQKLVTANLKFVVSVCLKYQNRGLPLTDLINEGNLGLIRAAKLFDETKNLKFITYAVWWVRQAILMALSEQSRLISLPLNRVTVVRNVGRAQVRLEQKLGRAPSPAEVAEELSLSEKDVRESLHLNLAPASLDAPSQRDRDGDASLLDFLEDESAENPLETVSEQDKADTISDVLQNLGKKEEEVLKLYFGIGVENAYTLEEIGYRFNVSRERARQIKEKALRRLRHSTLNGRLAEYRS